MIAHVMPAEMAIVRKAALRVGRPGSSNEIFGAPQTALTSGATTPSLHDGEGYRGTV